MSAKAPILPILPAVPTAPMAAAERRALAEALASLKRSLHDPASQQCAQEGYARVWIHLVLSRGLDPREAVGPKGRSYRAVLPAFLDAVERIGLHNRPSAAWWGAEVSQRASLLWRKAREAQGAALQPLPGLGLDTLATARPAWLDGMKSAAAADPHR